MCIRDRLLLILAGLPLSSSTKKMLCWLIVIGVIFFAGSIYGLATNSLTTFDFTKIALITPLGGTLLLVAWGLLIYRVINVKTI